MSFLDDLIRPIEVLLERWHENKFIYIVITITIIISIYLIFGN